MHQGGFYQFKYDITGMLQFDRPIYWTVVGKHFLNASINGAERKADFWLFGRYLPACLPRDRADRIIERVAIDAQANGDFNGRYSAMPAATKP